MCTVTRIVDTNVGELLQESSGGWVVRDAVVYIRFYKEHGYSV